MQLNRRKQHDDTSVDGILLDWQKQKLSHNND